MSYRHSLGNEKRKAKRTMPTPTAGAIGELLVSVDLLRRGYEVFRAVSPACSCDLIASKAGRLLRIEVRTGHYMTDQVTVRFTQRPLDEGRSDHFAVVLPDKIVYVPELN